MGFTQRHPHPNWPSPNKCPLLQRKRPGQRPGLSNSGSASGRAKKKHLIIYPNSGEIWDAREGKREWKKGASGEDGEEPMKYLTGHDACEWKALGATLVGGCCRVQPEQIKSFRAGVEGA